VLLIGDFAHADFSEPLAWLEKHCESRQASSVADARRMLRENGSPQVILFAQSRPGQYSQKDVEQLHVHSPLSRLVVLLGSWCEGETRTGRPWSGVVRVFWHQWDARMIPELSSQSTDSFHLWRMPRTVTGGDQLAQAAEGRWCQGEGLVVIRSRLFRDYQALGDACAAGGYASAWEAQDGQPFVTGAAAVLYSGIGGDPGEASEVAQLARRHAPTPVIALLDFLRGGDRRRMASAGAAAVLAKPFLVSDLLWHLDRHIRKKDSASDATRAA